MPLQLVSARMKRFFSGVGCSARRRKQPAIQINFDKHFNSLLPAQHDHDLLERKLELILHVSRDDEMMMIQEVWIARVRCEVTGAEGT